MLAVARLEFTNWADNLGIVGLLLFVGAILGTLVGRSRIHSTLSVILIFIYSIIVIPVIVLVDATYQGSLGDTAVLLVQRINHAGAQMLANQPVTDSILFILGLGLVYWILGTAAGFSMARTGSPWIPLLILGGATILIEHYEVGTRRQFYTLAYAVGALILLGRIYFLRIREGLKAENIKVGDESSFDFTRVVIIAAIILGLAGWYIPSLSRTIFRPSGFPTQLSQNWDRFTQNFAHLVFALQETGPTVEENAGNTMYLGKGQPLGLNEVLTIDTNKPAPLQNAYYWRLRVYDVYSNSQWSNGPVYKDYLLSSQRLPSPGYKSLVPVKIRVTTWMPQLGMVYVPGIPTSVGKQVDVSITTDGGSQADVLAIFTSPKLRNGERYRAEVEVSSATQSELTAAGTDYPQWILDRYLQVPSTLSPQIRNLSQELTAAQSTPFDKAVSVTNYLRSNISYQSTVSAPPVGTDVIDWFLFDYKKGFCNYYATAEVLLLRAAGVPARLAVGYAQGTQTSKNQYSVVARDSHAWPEVYFPGYGWIPFEPTASIAQIDYTGVSGANSQSGPGGAGNSSSTPGVSSTQNSQAATQAAPVNQAPGNGQGSLTLFGVLMLGVGIAGVLALVGFLIRLARKHKKAIQTRLLKVWQKFYCILTQIPVVGDLFLYFDLTPTQRSFFAVERGLYWLGIRLPPGSTSSEITATLIAEVPETEADAKSVLISYEQAIYSKVQRIQSEDRRAVRHINWAVFREMLKRLFTPSRRLKNRSS